MTIPYAPTPTGSSAADLLAWWRQRARTHPTARRYHDAARTALTHLGTETALRQISALTLDAERLVEAAAVGCWAPLSPPSRHHQALRLRRAVRLFRAAVEQHGTSPAPQPRPATASQKVPIVIEHAGPYDCDDGTSALTAYLAADDAVTAQARALLAAADLAAADATAEHLADLSAAVTDLETAVTAAGVAPDQVPAAAAALTAHLHRLDHNPGATR